jgi:hypothetical protein
MLALEAGDANGGDKRGKQSAALRIQGMEDYLMLDVRADEHPSPVQELRRILEVARRQLMPFVAGMPKRRELAGRSPPEVERLLALSPPDRPGGGGSYPDDGQAKAFGSNLNGISMTYKFAVLF